MKRGIIDYISRDDALMAERIVECSEAMDKRLYQDLSTLKGYLEANQEPPVAPLITFENKFSKMALGHHRDDVIETTLLNLFYVGQLSTMPPKLRSDDEPR